VVLKRLRSFFWGLQKKSWAAFSMVQNEDGKTWIFHAMKNIFLQKKRNPRLGLGSPKKTQQIPWLTSL